MGYGEIVMAVTIREVAQAAGVSVTAVSKVLHGRGKSVRVSPQKADVIREVAAQLKYRPNAIARNLRSSRTHTVGLIFENFWNISCGPLYYMHLLDGVASPLFKNHYRLTILPELSSDGIEGSLADGLLEGVVWCKMTHDPDTLKLISESPIPIVAMNAAPDGGHTDAVYIHCDNAQGMEQAVEHLWSLGHRKIAFVNEEQEQLTPDCIARRNGFLEAMARRGDEATAKCLTMDWKFEMLQSWWPNSEDVTAIICWTESAAGRLLESAQTVGISVPNELSIVGFDSTQYCDTTSPRLTAVRQPIFEMANRASETLLEMIAGETPASYSIIFPCSLDVRDSTAPILNSAKRKS